MFRIDSEGATLDNKFTEGDPSLGVPATVVSADWLNSVQEEMAGFIEYNGLTLEKTNSGQLQAALLEFFLRGGRQSPINQSLANNQAAASDVTGFKVDKATVKTKICFFDIERKTDLANKQQSGILFITRDTTDSEWRIGYYSLFDDDLGVVLSLVDDAGPATTSQLKYVTDNMAGATYSGSLRITSIFEIRL
jgi:hypothetical protein